MFVAELQQASTAAVVLLGVLAAFAALPAQVLNAVHRLTASVPGRIDATVSLHFTFAECIAWCCSTGAEPHGHRYGCV